MHLESNNAMIGLNRERKVVYERVCDYSKQYCGFAAVMAGREKCTGNSFEIYDRRRNLYRYVRTECKRVLCEAERGKDGDDISDQSGRSKSCTGTVSERRKRCIASGIFFRAQRNLQQHEAGPGRTSGRIPGREDLCDRYTVRLHGRGITSILCPKTESRRKDD